MVATYYYQITRLRNDRYGNPRRTISVWRVANDGSAFFAPVPVLVNSKMENYVFSHDKVMHEVIRGNGDDPAECRIYMLGGGLQ